MSTSPRTSEDELRRTVLEELPLHSAPLPLRMAFHDAASYDPVTRTGGATGSLHEELDRFENQSFAGAVRCMELARERHPDVSWADLIAVAGAVAVELCGGPRILVGMGRRDADRTPGDRPLPHEDTPIATLKAEFLIRALTLRDLVALSGAHTIGGRLQGPSFTADARSFTSSYFRRLLDPDADAGLTLLRTDLALVEDPELRPIVEEFAADQDAFLGAFADAYVRLTWLGQTRPAG